MLMLFCTDMNLLNIGRIQNVMSYHASECLPGPIAFCTCHNFDMKQTYALKLNGKVLFRNLFYACQYILRMLTCCWVFFAPFKVTLSWLKQNRFGARECFDTQLCVIRCTRGWISTGTQCTQLGAQPKRVLFSPGGMHITAKHCPRY